MAILRELDQTLVTKKSVHTLHSSNFLETDSSLSSHEYALEHVGIIEIHKKCTEPRLENRNEIAAIWFLGFLGAYIALIQAPRLGMGA